MAATSGTLCATCSTASSRAFPRKYTYFSHPGSGSD
jgi:hypothetical protein